MLLRGHLLPTLTLQPLTQLNIETIFLCLGFFLAWLWRRLSNGKPPAIRDATVEEQPGPAK